VWAQGKNPIPADTITGLYHPFRDAVATEYPNGTPYKNFLITDSIRQQYVWRQFSIEQLKQKQMPWWNPYNFSGTPHFANFQSASFYPLNIVFWFLPFTKAWNLLVISQSVLGGIFMYLYLRKGLELEKVSSLIGSLAWIFSGFFVVWLEWNTAGHVALWTPLVLLSIDKIFKVKGRKFRWNALLTFSLVAQFYAGYPQPWLYLSIVQGVYVVVNLISFGKNHSKYLTLPVASLIISYTLLLILILPQMSSTLEFSGMSNRTSDQGNVLEKVDWFLPYPQLIQMIVPDFFGNPTTGNYWGIFNYTEFVSYLGVIPVVLALTSIVSAVVDRDKKNKTSWKLIFFILFMFISLLLSTRNVISVAQFKYNLPFLGSSQPSRWLVITNFTLAILAAYGSQGYLKRFKSSLISLALLAAVFVALWITILSPQIWQSQSLLDNLSVAKRNLILPTIEFVGLVALTCLYYLVTSFKKTIKKQTLTFCFIGFIGLSTFSGIRFANKFTPFTNPEFLYPQTTVLSYLQENAGLYRYMTNDRRIMAPNINMAYDLYTIEGYDPLYLYDYGRLIYTTEQPDQNYSQTSKAFNRIVTTDFVESPIVNLLGVKYILSFDELNPELFKLVLEEGQTKLYENLNVLPRAFVAYGDDDYQTISVDQSVDILEYRPNQVTIKVNALQSGYLILSDSYYPDWKATIDGEAIKVENWYGLRRLKITQGEHEIVYKYSHTYL